MLSTLQGQALYLVLLSTPITSSGPMGLSLPLAWGQGFAQRGTRLRLAKPGPLIPTSAFATPNAHDQN